MKRLNNAAETSAVMKSQREVIYLALFRDIVQDVADIVKCPQKELHADLLTIDQRVASEGLSFLTKTLPSLGKALDKALHSDEPLTIPTSFKRLGDKRTPELFRWYFSKVIDPVSGNPLGIGDFDNPGTDVECLKQLRQLLYVMYKLEIPFTEDQERQALDTFVEVDGQIPVKGSLDLLDPKILATARSLVNSVFGAILGKDDDGNTVVYQEAYDPHAITPRHGPGAVATGERAHEKHEFKRIYASIEAEYPFTEYFVYNLAHVADKYHLYDDLEVHESGTAKVVLVPKDSRGPRVISCEPLELQWIQQGLMTSIVARLESHWLTKGHVNFTCQEVNRRLALEGSMDGHWVTLDMKEASDRVSLELVEHLFADQVEMLACLKACRSTHTVLPDGRTVQLRKFAPMGSAVCFPVEAFVFYVLSVAAMVHEYGLKRREASSLVYVYGDDIIASSKYYGAIDTHLPKVGLQFNRDKCCTKGFFRESCGCDAFIGIDVTPLRMKKVLYQHSLGASTIVANIEYGNAFFARKMYRVAGRIRQLIYALLGFQLPTTKSKVGFLSWVNPDTLSDAGDCKVRWNKSLHTMQIKAPASVPVHITVDPDDWSMILRTQSLTSGFEPEVIRLDVRDAAAPGTFAITRRNKLKRVWSTFY